MSFNIKITTAEELKAHMRLIEQKNRVLENDIKDGFRDLGDSMKPSHIIRNSVEGMKSSPVFRNKMVNAAIGLGVGYFLKRKFGGKTKGIIKNAAGTALKIGFANLIGRNLGLGGRVLGRIFSKPSARA